MRFYTQTHKYYCGIDLHARTMYVCVVDQNGTLLVHQNLKTSAEQLLAVMAPYREDLVVAVECIFCWYWIADLCAREGIAFVLGHALYMKAIHGSKTKSDKLDSQKIALLLKGGLIPQAYLYPPGMRATRDLLRRRLHLMRKRADLIAHIQNTVSQYNLPALNVSLGRKHQRYDIARHFPDPVVRQMIELDLRLIDTYDEEIRVLDQDLALKAKAHDAHSYHLIRSVPGIGRVLTLVILYEIHHIGRFPSVQQFASYARLVKCTKESAGKVIGKTNKKIGNSYLKWAFGEAAVLFLRKNPPAQKYLERLAAKHGKGKALAILAHRLGRTVYTMLKTGKPFDRERFMATLN
jgi:transposase